MDKEKAMQEVEAERDEHPGDEGDKEKREPDVYDRFPKSKKRIILFIVSYAAFLGRESPTSLSHIHSDRTRTGSVNDHYPCQP